MMRRRPSLGQLEIGKVLTSDPYSLATTLAPSPPTKNDQGLYVHEEIQWAVLLILPIRPPAGVWEQEVLHLFLALQCWFHFFPQ